MPSRAEVEQKAKPRTVVEEIERFITPEGQRKVEEFMAEPCDDNFDINEALDQCNEDSVLAMRGWPAEDVALWRRICQLATDQPKVQPDMDGERFARILSAEKCPTPLDVALMCDAFGVTAAWLLTGDEHGLCEGTHKVLYESVEAGRRQVEELKAALNRLRAEHAKCPGAHNIETTFFSEAEGCDLVVCSCGWTYDAEEQCPGIGEVDA